MQFGEKLMWSFCIADVMQPIVGVVFLVHFALAVDARQKILVNLGTMATISCHRTTCAPILIFCRRQEQIQVSSTLAPPSLSCPFAPRSPSMGSFGLYHHIPMTGAPVFSRSRRLQPEKLKEVQHQFDKMLALGVIHPFKSAVVSASLRTKAGWINCPCGDVR